MKPEAASKILHAYFLILHAIHSIYLRKISKVNYMHSLLSYSYIAFGHGTSDHACTYNISHFHMHVCHIKRSSGKLYEL